MATVHDFVADPPGFMATNVVQVIEVDPEDPKFNQQPLNVTLHDTGIAVSNRRGGRMFELYPTSDPNLPSVPAFFCPYKNDESHFINLDNRADYMFTPQMAGCSFGIGTQNGGDCRVGHVNFISLRQDWDDEAEKSARMYSAQNAFLRNRLNVGSDRLIVPTDYRGPRRTRSATTFGVRDANQVWSFHTLRYKRTSAMLYRHYGIHQHVNT